MDGISPFFLRTIETNNLFKDTEKNVLKWHWVENNNDSTPKILGLSGSNGSYKSSLLSQKFPWLMHPLSHPMMKDSDPNYTPFARTDVHSCSVTIELEWKGDLYRAKRIFRSSINQEKFLWKLDKNNKKKPEPVTSLWDNIFGKDFAAAITPYFFNHETMNQVSQLLATEGHLMFFSDNLGHKPLLESISNKKSEIDQAIVNIVSSKLSDDKKSEYEEHLEDMSKLNQREKENKTKLIQFNDTNDNYQLHYKNPFTYFQSNEIEIENAKTDFNLKKNKHIMNLELNTAKKIIEVACFASLLKYLEATKEIDKNDLTSEVDQEQINILQSFKSEFNDDWDSLSPDIKAKHDVMINSEQMHKVNILANSSSNDLENDLEEITTFYKAYKDAQTKLDEEKDKNSINGVLISQNDFMDWKKAYDGIEECNEETKKIKAEYKKKKIFLDIYNKHVKSNEDYNRYQKQLLLLKIIENSINQSIDAFHKESVKQMLTIAEQILSVSVPNKNIKLKLDDDNEIIPEINGKDRPMKYSSGKGGPSSGEKKQISLAIMAARYLKSNVHAPLLLDDTVGEIDDDAEGSLMKEVVKRVLARNSQLIWIGTNKFSLEGSYSSDYSQLNVVPSEGAGWESKPPWNGNSPKIMKGGEIDF